MSLEDFLAEERVILERFAAMWREGAAKDPESFPPDLPGGEWWEQLLAFVA